MKLNGTCYLFCWTQTDFAVFFPPEAKPHLKYWEAYFRCCVAIEKGQTYHLRIQIKEDENWSHLTMLKIQLMICSGMDGWVTRRSYNIRFSIWSLIYICTIFPYFFKNSICIYLAVKYYIFTRAYDAREQKEETTSNIHTNFEL